MKFDLNLRAVELTDADLQSVYGGDSGDTSGAGADATNANNGGDGLDLLLNHDIVQVPISLTDNTIGILGRAYSHSSRRGGGDDEGDWS